MELTESMDWHGRQTSKSPEEDSTKCHTLAICRMPWELRASKSYWGKKNQSGDSLLAEGFLTLSCGGLVDRVKD